MLGKRTLFLTLALLAMLCAGHAVAPVIHQAVVLNPQLENALASSDLERAERLILSGADVNLHVPAREWSSPRSALALAAHQGDGAAVERLLRLGADVNRQDSSGAAPLMFAAGTEQTDALRVLLKAGANVNASDEMGGTALMRAAAPDWTAFDADGTRIHREPDAVKLLLAAGADPNLRNAQGESAMSQAEQAAEVKIVSVFRKLGARGLRDELSGVPEADLFYAVRTQNMREVKRLIRRGASVAVQDKGGMTPLMYAAQQFDGVLIHFLLGHARDVKASLELRDDRGETVLFRSVIYDYSFRKLLEAGADPSTSADNGDTLYKVAYPEQQKLLLRYGAKPSAQ